MAAARHDPSDGAANHVTAPRGFAFFADDQ